MTYETSPIMRRMTLAFLRVEKNTALNGCPGFPPQIGLAVAATETGWFASMTGANNYFGITRAPTFPGDPLSAWCSTTEYSSPAGLLNFRHDERSTAVLIAPGKYSMKRWFAAYPNLVTAVSAYVSLLTDATRYHPAWLQFQKTNDADEFLRQVCQSGYATGPAFKVELEIAHQANILAAVAAGRLELQANPNAD